MKPFISICGFPIPTYLLCAGAGAIIVIPLFSWLLIRKKIFHGYFKISLISIIGLILGARLFGFIGYSLTTYFENNYFSLKESIENSGIVFYGGLIGFVCSCYIICKVTKHQFNAIANEIAICIPLFHSIGRIGCFYAGCCYGVEYDGIFAIMYPGKSGMVKVFPTQIIEAAFEILLFGIILLVYFKRYQYQYKNTLLVFYMVSYSIFRFWEEFYRGDVNRSVWTYISFSQYISVAIIVVVLFVLIHKQVIIKRKQRIL